MEIDPPRNLAMFRRRKTLKISTTLLILVAIAATGFDPVARANGPCSKRDSVKSRDRHARLPDGVAAASTDESRTCCCRRDNDSPPPPPAAPNDPERTSKWVPWIDAPSRVFMIVTHERASLPCAVSSACRYSDLFSRCSASGEFDGLPGYRVRADLPRVPVADIGRAVLNWPQFLFSSTL